MATKGSSLAKKAISSKADSSSYQIISRKLKSRMIKGGSQITTIPIPIPPSLPAVIYYVSTTGDNSNDGRTESTPWQTLAYAVTQAEAGSTIYMMTGTHTQTAQIDLPVKINLTGGGVTSIIECNWGGGTSQPSINLSSVQGTDGDQTISNLRFDGDGLTADWPILVSGRNNVVIHDCEFEDFAERGVVFRGHTSNPPDIYATGLEFYNNTITNCSEYFGSGRGCLEIGGTEGMLIHDNTLSQTGRAAGTNGYVIKMHLSGYNKGLKIYDNTITKEPYDGSTYDFAVELWNGQGGMEFYGNTVQGSLDLNDYAKGSYSFSAHIHDNIFSQSILRAARERGILLEQNIADVIIESNWFENLTEVIYLRGGGNYTFSDINIYNNIMYNIGSSDTDYEGYGLRSNGFVGTDIVTNLRIYNNDIIAEQPYDSHTMRGVDIPAGGTTSNVVIRNNVIQEFGHCCIGADGAGTIDILSIENNLFYNNDFSDNYIWAGGVIPTNVTDQNNIRGSDPDFNSLGTNFHPKTGSPLLGAGIDIAGYTVDYEDTGVGSPPNIGAYETIQDL